MEANIHFVMTSVNTVATVAVQSCHKLISDVTITRPSLDPHLTQLDLHLTQHDPHLTQLDPHLTQLNLRVAGNCCDRLWHNVYN